MEPVESVESVESVELQGSLLGSGAPEVDRGFTGLSRLLLDADGDAWADVVPGWLSGSDAVFSWLLEHEPWGEMEMYLYGEKRLSPRLVARLEVESLPSALSDARALLSARYRVDFTSVGVNLYRDGRDSVAWHGDRVARNRPTAVVATVSVGQRRRFLLRPRGGGPSVRFDLGQGDLLVMGGSCQRIWQHTVPKVASAGPRMSVTFRHAY